MSLGGVGPGQSPPPSAGPVFGQEDILDILLRVVEQVFKWLAEVFGRVHQVQPPSIVDENEKTLAARRAQLDELDKRGPAFDAAYAAEELYWRVLTAEERKRVKELMQEGQFEAVSTELASKGEPCRRACEALNQHWGRLEDQDQARLEKFMRKGQYEAVSAELEQRSRMEAARRPETAIEELREAAERAKRQVEEGMTSVASRARAALKVHRQPGVAAPESSQPSAPAKPHKGPMSLEDFASMSAYLPAVAEQIRKQAQDLEDAYNDKPAPEPSGWRARGSALSARVSALGLALPTFSRGRS